MSSKTYLFFQRRCSGVFVASTNDFYTMLNDLVGLNDSELCPRERKQEQQLKQSAQREQKLRDELARLKDFNSRLLERLRSATDIQTSLKQQLKHCWVVVDQRDYLIKKGKYDTKKKEKEMQADLKRASDSESDLRRQVTELQQQLQQAAERQRMTQVPVTSLTNTAVYSKPGKFCNIPLIDVILVTVAGTKKN